MFWSDLPKPIKILAPMEDVTDTVFRQIVAKCGRPDVFFTEFTSTDGLFSPGKERVTERLEYTEKERPLVAQIWGKNPENYFKACQEINARGFDGIDINMGCPVKKITEKGCCAALIDQPALTKELIQAAKEGAGTLPVSVKTRLGFKNLKTIEWAGFLLEQDIPVLTMHGRLAKDQSKYPADWNEIAKVAELRNEMKKDTLIIGNGDVTSYAEIYDKHETTGVDGVMVGRGIFNDLNIFSADKLPFAEETPEQKLMLLKEHLSMFQTRWGPDKRYAAMKKFYKVYVSNFPQASELRAKLMDSANCNEAARMVSLYLD